MLHPKALEALKRRGSASPLFKCPRVDFGKLKTIVKRPIKDFHIYSGIGNLEKVNTVNGPYFYRDNGAKILVVAHLDSVQHAHWAGVLNFPEDTRIYASTLDDRLGVYVALELLQKAGLEYDILLTTNEEAGNSTAQWFEPPKGKKYNWIVSFDRKGDDIVTYSYTDPDWIRSLRSVGFRTGVGTYSCITDLDHLGACGVNIGIGFHDYHTQKAYASLNEIRSQISKFLRFYNEFYEVEFPYTPKLNVVSRSGLRFAYDVIGRFTDEELQIAIDYYEQLQAGATFADLGFPNQARITKEDIAAMRKNPKLKLIRTRDAKSEQLAIAFPKSKTKAIETKTLITDSGNKATIVEKCVECGKFFEVDEPHTEAYCPTCKAVIENRHALDDKDPAHIARDEKPASSLSNKEALINSITTWLKSPDVKPQAIGMALRLVRENLDEKVVKDIYDTLIEKKYLKQFRNGKLGKTNYPPTPSKKVILTLKGMSALIKKVGVDTSKISQKNDMKWVSKLELGHRGVWAYPKDLEPLEDYLLLLMDYVDDDWMKVLDLIQKIDYMSISEKLNKEFGLPGIGEATETVTKETKTVTKEDKTKPIIKLKYKLDTSNKEYDFRSTREKGGISFGWEKITPEPKQLVRPKFAA